LNFSRSQTKQYFHVNLVHLRLETAKTRKSGQSENSHFNGRLCLFDFSLQCFVWLFDFRVWSSNDQITARSIREKAIGSLRDETCWWKKHCRSLTNRHDGAIQLNFHEQICGAMSEQTQRAYSNRVLFWNDRQGHGSLQHLEVHATLPAPNLSRNEPFRWLQNLCPYLVEELQLLEIPFFPLRIIQGNSNSLCNDRNWENGSPIVALALSIRKNRHVISEGASADERD
jgi:hypothetical protein